MFKGKISVIGAGYVGTATAYTLMLSGLVSDIALIDIDANKAAGEALDMNHGISFVSPVQMMGGSDYSLIKGSDLIIITAGANQKPGETRIDLLKRNTVIYKRIVADILANCDNDAILLVVTNPVDILTYITGKLSGLDRRRVIGSGTVLDTARLKYLIGKHTHIDPRDIHTYIVGEHGDSEVPLWSLSSIGGIPFDAYCQFCNGCNGQRLCKETFYNTTKNAAYEIIQKKGATYYAIALSIKRIVEAIIGSEDSMLTVSSLLTGEYGLSEVCLSVPSIVNKNGVERIVEVPLAENEMRDLHKSAGLLKDLINQIGF